MWLHSVYHPQRSICRRGEEYQENVTYHDHPSQRSLISNLCRPISRHVLKMIMSSVAPLKSVSIKSYKNQFGQPPARHLRPNFVKRGWDSVVYMCFDVCQRLTHSCHPRAPVKRWHSCHIVNFAHGFDRISVMRGLLRLRLSGLCMPKYMPCIGIIKYKKKINHYDGQWCILSHKNSGFNPALLCSQMITLTCMYVRMMIVIDLIASRPLCMTENERNSWHVTHDIWKVKRAISFRILRVLDTMHVRDVRAINLGQLGRSIGELKRK